MNKRNKAILLFVLALTVQLVYSAQLQQGQQNIQQNIQPPGQDQNQQIPEQGQNQQQQPGKGQNTQPPGQGQTNQQLGAAGQLKANFSNQFNTFAEKRPGGFNRPPQKNGQSLSNMRQTTNGARNITDVSQFVFNFIATNQLSADSSSSIADASQILQSFISSNPSLCPYVSFLSSISCNATSRYQTYDGTCNNLAQPLLGKSESPYKRYLKPAYSDGFNTQRMLGVSGKPLVNPRSISLVLSPPNPNERLQKNLTLMLPIFGQFLTHDIAGTAASTDSNGVEISCGCTSTDPLCSMAVSIPQPDGFVSMKCMNFTRSAPTFPNFNCSLDYREQLNLLSHYIDGTQIYGSSLAKSQSLRTFVAGGLKTSPGIQSNRRYLPLSNDTCAAYTATTERPCFLAGEFRTSENLHLASIHTLFNREHNRIAAVLSAQSPIWSDEKVYQETRRIVTALYQHVVFNEWLPMVTGNFSLKPMSASSGAYFTGYNSNVNPSLANEFATAAFRFGHSLIRNKLSRYSNNQNRLPGPVNFTDVVFKSELAYDVQNFGLNGLFLGLINDNAWEFGTFSDQMQNHLFEQASSTGKGTVAMDLLATNINRGRDHGVPSYTSFVKYCTGKIINTWSDLKNTFRGNTLNDLTKIYENVNDIDLYVGGLSELSINNGIVGPTFSCIIMNQFKDLKTGDRFYYENGPSATSFTLAQLAELRKATLSRLICNNYDIVKVQANPFLNPSTGNPLSSCSSYYQPDLTQWKNN